MKDCPTHEVTDTLSQEEFISVAPSVDVLGTGNRPVRCVLYMCTKHCAPRCFYTVVIMRDFKEQPKIAPCACNLKTLPILQGS